MQPRFIRGSLEITMTRNGRSWSPGEYAAGHQERLLLLGGK